MYAARPLNEPSHAEVTAFATRAYDRRLVICGGAGLSRADPTELPLGPELARTVHTMLADALGPDALEDADPDDLLSVADAAERVVGGADLVQTTLRQAADFTTAEPNFGHEALALLVIEGALEAVLTNWDDCVERGGGSFGRLQAIITNADEATVIGPAVLKVHGCATRVGSLMASSSQLADPPTWVLHHLGGRLGDSTVVFVGLGDVPTYVQIRIEQLLSEIGDLHQVWVVAPNLSPTWQELVPDVADRFIEMTADEFLDQLVRAYVRLPLSDLCERARGHREARTYEELDLDVVSGVNALIATLEELEGKSALMWLRQAAYRWPGGERFLRSPQLDMVLLALGLLAARRGLELAGHRLRFQDALVEILVVRGQPAARVVDEAARRLERARTDGEIGMTEKVTFVVHGHEGPLPANQPFRVLPGGGPSDVIDGPRAPNMELVAAHRVVDGDLPEPWAA